MTGGPKFTKHIIEDDWGHRGAGVGHNASHEPVKSLVQDGCVYIQGSGHFPVAKRVCHWLRPPWDLPPPPHLLLSLKKRWRAEGLAASA